MRNVWLIAEQISVCLICRWKYPPLLTAFATAVVKNVPLKIYCWDRFVFLVRLQSVEIYGSSAKEICLRFHKAYTGCNGIAFYSAPFAKTVWVFFSDGSESNIEFGKMFSIKYEPATMNASLMLLKPCYILHAIIWTQSFWNAVLIWKEGKRQMKTTPHVSEVLGIRFCLNLTEVQVLF